MKLLRRSGNPEYKYSLAFVGYGNNPDHAEIELTYTHGTDSYDMGTAYGHIALGVPDAYAACEKIKSTGGNVTREAGPVKGGSTVIAFVTDPDGYKIELRWCRCCKPLKMQGSANTSPWWGLMLCTPMKPLLAFVSYKGLWPPKTLIFCGTRAGVCIS